MIKSFIVDSTSDNMRLDRWLRNKSIQMFDIYVMHYGLSTAEEVARCWNGGPRGMDKDATVYYWNKVQDYLDS